MEFSFTGVTRITLDHRKGEQTSRHVSTDYYLDLSPNLPKRFYLDSDGLPTKEGIKPLTQCFIQGLVANIHTAHKNGYWDSAEHLRYIIAELERGFINQVTITKGKF